MTKNTTDELVELVRQIHFLLTGRYVSVNTAAIQRAILDWHEQEIADYLSRIVKSADSEGRIWAETIHEQIKKLRSKS